MLNLYIFWDFRIFLMKVSSKMMKKWEEDDEERGKKLDVGDSWYDTIDTHNPTV